MPGPARTAQAFGHHGDIHPGQAVHAIGIHLGHRRREQQVAVGLVQLATVFRQGARIGVQILGGTELQRIDEDARHHEVGVTPRGVDQGDMAGVQIAHGGHQADAQALAARGGDGGAQFADAMDRFHAENPCSGAGKLPSLTAAT